MVLTAKIYFMHQIPMSLWYFSVHMWIEKQCRINKDGIKQRKINHLLYNIIFKNNFSWIDTQKKILCCDDSK